MKLTVIIPAYNEGGAAETVEAGRTGAFFDNQIPESLNEAVAKFEMSKFNINIIRARAENFSTEKFIKDISSFIKRIRC